MDVCNMERITTHGRLSCWMGFFVYIYAYRRACVGCISNDMHSWMHPGGSIWMVVCWCYLFDVVTHTSMISRRRWIHTSMLKCHGDMCIQCINMCTLLNSYTHTYLACWIWKWAPSTRILHIPDMYVVYTLCPSHVHPIYLWKASLDGRMEDAEGDVSSILQAFSGGGVGTSTACIVHVSHFPIAIECMAWDDRGRQAGTRHGWVGSCMEVEDWIGSWYTALCQYNDALYIGFIRM